MDFPFDPSILSAPERRGFDLLYPDWDNIPTFSKPTYSELKVKLKTVDLAYVTEDAENIATSYVNEIVVGNVQCAEMLLREIQSHYSNESDMCILTNRFSINIVSNDYNNINILINDSVYDLYKLAKSIGETMKALSNSPINVFRMDFKFLDAMPTQIIVNFPEKHFKRLQDIYNILNNDYENIDSLAREVLNILNLTFESLMHTNLAGICIKCDEKDFKMDSVEMANDLKLSISEILLGNLFWQSFIGVLSTSIMGHAIRSQPCILGGVSIRSKLVENIFGKYVPYTFKPPVRHVSLKELYDKGIKIHLGGKSAKVEFNKDSIMIGPLNVCQVETFLRAMVFEGQSVIDSNFAIYYGLLNDPESFKLASTLGIVEGDYFDYVALGFGMKNLADNHSNKEYKAYVDMSNQFYTWHERLKRDFLLSFTRDAFSLMISIAAVVISLTGIIQAVKAFL